MAIDIRARVESNLGPVISADISDDYIQGNGLIRTTGSCVVKGLVSPSIGTKIVFSYTKNGITRQVPRALRVLSSFADPFRKTTSVQLGCKLTYLQDLKDPIDWTAFDDPDNGGFTEEDNEIIVVPIRAQAVAEKCLSELGITASGLSLSNLFSIESFDLSSGYVQVLGDLLVSECFCGWLDFNEKLQIINLSTAGGTGPLIQESDIIDVGEIGVGQIPGDAVVVSYSSLKLKLPEGEEITQEDTEDLFSGWESDETSSSNPGAIIAYKNRYEVDVETEEAPAPLRFAYYNSYNSSSSTTNYKIIDVIKDGIEWTYSIFGINVKMSNGLYRTADFRDYEKRSVVESRETIEQKSLSEVAGGWITDALSLGLNPGNYTTQVTTTETFSYDPNGNEVFRTLEKIGDVAYLVGSSGISYVYEIEDSDPPEYSFVPLPTGTVYLEYITTKTDYLEDYTRVTTKRWGPWFETISGQQSIAAAQEYINTAEEATNFLLETLYSGLYLIDTTINTSRSRQNQQSRPSSQQILQSSLGEYSTESSSEIELATGNPSAQLRIEFSLPYAPDDTFFISSAGPPTVYGSTASDAQQKAKQFGIIQNKLLLGNRSGMNIQTVPEKLPLSPFSPFFISANGVISLYRTNATSWTIDSNGIIVSSDALYWGVAGQV